MLSLLIVSLCPHSLSILVSVKRESAVVRQDHLVRQPASPSDYQGTKYWSHLWWERGCFRYLFARHGLELFWSNKMLLYLLNFQLETFSFLSPMQSVPADTVCSRHILWTNCKHSLRTIFSDGLCSIIGELADYPVASLGTFKVSAVRSLGMKMQLLKTLLETQQRSIS